MSNNKIYHIQIITESKKEVENMSFPANDEVYYNVTSLEIDDAFNIEDIGSEKRISPTNEYLLQAKMVLLKLINKILK